MDAAEPPRIVFESATECVDRDGAEKQWRQGLAEAHAPEPGWVARIRFVAAPPPAVSVDGQITDAGGVVIAHHVLSGESANCAALGDAMAAWVSDVLWSEVRRAQAKTNPAQQPITETAPGRAAAPATDGMDICRVTPDAPSCLAQREVNLAVEAKRWPLCDSDGGRCPEPEAPALELGVGPFLMIGGAAGGYAGVTPFFVAEVAQGVYLRPSIAVGQSLSADVSSIWAAARIDACARLPGHYATHNGLELDLCGGPDVGFSYVGSGTVPGTPPAGKTMPYVNLGPSVDLRGDVGRVAVSLRGVVGINVARDGFVDVAGTRVETSLVAGRLELDFSWALRR